MLRHIFKQEYPPEVISLLEEKHCLDSAVVCQADIGYRVYDSSLPGFYRYIGVYPENGGMAVYYNRDSSFYEMDRVMLATRVGWYLERNCMSLGYCYSLYSLDNLFDAFRDVNETSLAYTNTSIAAKSLASYILQRGIVSKDIREPMELMKIEGIYPYGDIRISNPLDCYWDVIFHDNSYKNTVWLN